MPSQSSPGCFNGGKPTEAAAPQPRTAPAARPERGWLRKGLMLFSCLLKIIICCHREEWLIIIITAQEHCSLLPIRGAECKSARPGLVESAHNYVPAIIFPLFFQKKGEMPPEGSQGVLPNNRSLFWVMFETQGGGERMKQTRATFLSLIFS